MTTVKSMRTMANDILYQSNYFYQVTGKILDCNMSMWTTSEGLYLTSENQATSLKKSKTDMDAIHKLRVRWQMEDYILFTETSI